MRPTLLRQSDEQPILRSIITSLTSINCSEHFSEHDGRSQPEKRSIVGGFQGIVRFSLERAIPEIEWSEEHRPSRTNRDSIDIFGRGLEFVVAIELDAWRADQVAKKFVSRMALLPATTVYFISLCYPGTERMNREECEKYFGYCATLALRMGSHYAGLVITEA